MALDEKDKHELAKNELRVWENTLYTLQIRAQAAKVAGNSTLLDAATKEMESVMKMVAELEKIVEQK